MSETAEARDVPAHGPGEFQPKQARGQRSRRRLLDATAGALAEKGPDGVTVADVAARAGMSVGNVYRRFDSKDALLRALEADVLADREGFWEDFLSPDEWRGRELEDLVRAVVDQIVSGHRRHLGLLRALALHARDELEDRSPEVGGGPAGLLSRLIRQVWPGSVQHRDVHRAVALAFEMVSATAGELLLFRRGGLDGLDMDDEALAEELTRMAMAYLRGSGS